MSPSPKRKPSYSIDRPQIAVSDYLQAERLTKTTRVLRICTDRELGYIHIVGGEVTHATTAECRGDRALEMMLRWQSPIIDRMDAEPSSERTVFADAVSPATPNEPFDNIIEFCADVPELDLEVEPDDEPSAEPDVTIDAEIDAEPSAEIDAARDIEPSATSSVIPSATSSVIPSTTPSTKIDADIDVNTDEDLPVEARAETVMSNQQEEVSVHLSPDGRVLASRGAADDLADLAAYANRLGQLCAETLGLEELVALECVSESETVIIYRKDDKSLVAVKPADRESTRVIKEKLDL